MEGNGGMKVVSGVEMLVREQLCRIAGVGSRSASASPFLAIGVSGQWCKR